MTRALALAEKGRGWVSPNPMVGCVVVRDGKIIGEGYHEIAGGAHAEVNALSKLDDPSGATVYVTLEPCCHHGKTPPCAEFLCENRLARIVVAMEDPNPVVSGQGFARLRESGVAVEVGLMEDEARLLNEAFIKYVSTKKPFVIAKCGMSLDGRIATHTGDSKWVTGEASREWVHRLRNQVDAILVGSRTVMLDDPSLTTRLNGSETRDPVRVVLDSHEYLDASRSVFHQDSPAPTWVATASDETFEAADDTIMVGASAGGLDMAELMGELAKREITTVLIEGGGSTLGSAFEAGIVDKVMFFIAPKIVGGREAVSAVEGAGVEKMNDAISLRDMTATAVGSDVLLQAYVESE
jgi:diaminohydroxyphosphoribosylaminopyrimidine deaminase/5-amino-6-(5-phosphoribosylamino)uracil reductase